MAGLHAAIHNPSLLPKWLNLVRLLHKYSFKTTGQLMTQISNQNIIYSEKYCSLQTDLSSVWFLISKSTTPSVELQRLKSFQEQTPGF